MQYVLDASSNANHETYKANGLLFGWTWWLQASFSPVVPNRGGIPPQGGIS